MSESEATKSHFYVTVDLNEKSDVKLDFSKSYSGPLTVTLHHYQVLPLDVAVDQYDTTHEFREPGSYALGNVEKYIYLRNLGSSEIKGLEVRTFGELDSGMQQ